MPALLAYALRRAMLPGTAILLVAALAGGSGAAVDGPVLHVTVNDSPPYVFVPGSPPVQLSVAAGQPVRMAWEASPGDNNEPVEAFRFGWNIADPNNDEQWEQSWCAACRSAPPRTFHSGTQRFFVQGRDRVGLITTGQIEIVIVPVAITPNSWSHIKSLFGR